MGLFSRFVDRVTTFIDDARDSLADFIRSDREQPAPPLAPESEGAQSVQGAQSVDLPVELPDEPSPSPVDALAEQLGIDPEEAAGLREWADELGIPDDSATARDAIDSRVESMKALAESLGVPRELLDEIEDVQWYDWIVLEVDMEDYFG